MGGRRGGEWESKEKDKRRRKMQKREEIFVFFQVLIMQNIDPGWPKTHARAPDLKH